MVVSKLTHTDIVLPLQTETIDWGAQFSLSQFRGDISNATRVAIGWGDHDFYPQTRTLSDFRIVTMIKALFWPTRSCIHVVFLTEDLPLRNLKSVKISDKQYEKLVDVIQGDLRLNPIGQLIQIENAAYHNHDAFFEAYGHYTMFKTCNNWIGNALIKAGLKTGWYTPLPKTVVLYW